MSPSRSLLTIATAVLVAALLAVGCDSAGSGPSDDSPATVAPEDAEPGVWTSVKTTTDNTVHDVAVTADGAYAVAEGGVLLKRTPQEWTTVFNNGVAGNGNDLFGLAITDDGTRLWMVGASGAVGEYDVTTGSLTDRSRPVGSTNNFNDVAVTGTADSANVYVSGDSGKMFYSSVHDKTRTVLQTLR